MHNSLWNKGRTSIQGQALYVRSARQAAQTHEYSGCFASLRSVQGAAPLAPLSGYPCVLCSGNNAEGYVTEQSHGGADISSERRSVFLYDKVKDDEIEITVFSRYIDKNTYLKVQYLPHTKYGAIVEIK